jgi:hypothetical protein
MLMKSLAIKQMQQRDVPALKNLYHVRRAKVASARQVLNWFLEPVF